MSSKSSWRMVTKTLMRLGGMERGWGVIVLMDDGLAELGASGPGGDGLPGMELVISGVIAIQSIL